MSELDNLNEEVESEIPMIRDENKLIIYLAAPFFNETQVQRVRDLEKLLESCDSVPIKVFSPSRDGMFVQPDASRSDRKLGFDINVGTVEQCDAVVAILDDPDTGTHVELGMAYAMSKFVVGFYTTDKPKMNLMLSELLSARYQSDNEGLIKYLTFLFKCKSSLVNRGREFKQDLEALNSQYETLNVLINQASSDRLAIANDINTLRSTKFRMDDELATQLESYRDETLFSGIIE